MPAPNVLIVNPFGIGDVLFTTPMIAALKASVPDVRISYLANARTAPFLKNDPRISRVFSYERDEYIAIYRRSPWAFLMKWKELIDGIKAERFDRAYDLSMNAGLGIALALAGIQERIGYDYKGRGRFLTRKVPLKGFDGRHVAEYYLDLIGQGVGSRESGVKQKYFETSYSQLPTPSHSDIPVFAMSLISSVDDIAWAQKYLSDSGIRAGEAIIVYPGGGASWGSGAGLKRWPAERFGELLDKILACHTCPIILMGDLSEQELCAGLSRLHPERIKDLSGRTTLGQAAALMASAKLVIANDGGPLHMAVAVGARTFSIFGPVDENVYGPWPRDGHVVATKDLPCRPCYRNFRMSNCEHRSCLNDLGVDEVFAKFNGAFQCK